VNSGSQIAWVRGGCCITWEIQKGDMLAWGGRQLFQGRGIRFN
jgi:hypothetical protein